MTTFDDVALRRATRGDRGALSTFVCADPPKPVYRPATGRREHPRPWEFDAQAIIRSLSRSVPNAPRTGQAVYVADDDEGLAAVASWTAHRPDLIHIDVLGVASRHRRRGGSFARGFLRSILQFLEADAIEAGATTLYVEAEIYERNDASQKLAEAFGMRHWETHITGAETWQLNIPIGDVIQ